MYRFILLIALGGVIFCEMGCSTTDSISTTTSFFDRLEPAPQQHRELTSGDIIELSVEVDGRMEVVAYRVSLGHEGFATLPLVGEVELGGCTLDNAQEVIAKTYGVYYVQPPVIMLSLVNDGETGGFGAVIVLGKVRRPGRIALNNAHGMNLTEAIMDAGGFAASAKKSEIRISRSDKEGRKRHVVVDYNEIGRGGTAEADIKLIAGDLIYVPERIW
ncbi:MAG: polysaccharide biosynthesis/export family protein [Pontiella sp.]